MPLDVTAQFDAHRARVYRWARVMCHDHEDARDVVQEVFLRMVRNPPDVPSAAAAVAWLRRVTDRVMIDRWRSSAAAPRTTDDLAAVTSDPSPESRETAAAIRGALEALSPQQRLTLVCKACDGMTFREIASELGIAISTAKTHYVRGLDAVRERLNLAHFAPGGTR